jgi:hypothetical protein
VGKQAGRPRLDRMNRILGMQEKSVVVFIREILFIQSNRGRLGGPLKTCGPVAPWPYDSAGKSQRASWQGLGECVEAPE